MIDKHKVISFDIFDTLLIRPYIKPTDLFLHLEKLNNANGFKDARIKAEKEIRVKYNKQKKDINFDEIYQTIDKKYKWLKEKELLLEYTVINARPFMKEIYEYAYQQNKKIIVISDMYLPKDFLSDVLKKNGYINIDKLYVSSESRKSKKFALLFKMVIEDLNIPKKDILHIGDNLFTDIKQSRKLGINSFYVPKIKNFFFESDTQLNEFYLKHNDDIGTSIMLGLLAYHSELNYRNYWYEFGYKYAGPVIFGYMQWLNNKLKKDEINEVLFVGRDGYTPEKVYKIINNSTITHYFYFPRKVAYAILKNKDNVEMADKIKEEFINYINQFNLNDKKLSLVDGISYNLSFQKVIKRIFPKTYIKGSYFSVGKKGFKNMLYDGFLKKHKANLAKIIQFIMTAPTPPVKSIENGNPVFKEANEAEIEIIKLYPELSKGAIDFAKDCKKFFKNLNLYFSDEMVADWLYKIMNNPSEMDKNMFFNIEFSLKVDHNKYQKLFKKWYK